MPSFDRLYIFYHKRKKNNRGYGKKLNKKALCNMHKKMLESSHNFSIKKLAFSDSLLYNDRA